MDGAVRASGLDVCGTRWKGVVWRQGSLHLLVQAYPRLCATT